MTPPCLTNEQKWNHQTFWNPLFRLNYEYSKNHQGKAFQTENLWL